MAYKLVAFDDFSADRTLDPNCWAWYYAPPYIVLGGHMAQDSSEAVGMGRFVLGGEHMAQRITVKFTKTDADGWLYVLARAREVQGFGGPGLDAIWAESIDDNLAISSGGGTYVAADDPAVLAVGTPYWLRMTIDATHNTSAEIFDADPNSGAEAIYFLSSDLPDEDEEAYPGFDTVPGYGGLRTTPGILVDEIRYEVPEVSIADDRNVPHEKAVGDAIDAQARRTSDHAAIADLTPTASVGYVQAEATAVRGKVNEILDVLRDAELIP